MGVTGPRAFLLVVMGAGLLAPHCAFAQERDARERIVVTAGRASESARSTPLSLMRLDEAALARIAAEHPSEALNRAPGVLVHRGSGQEHLTAIRSPVLTAGAGAGSFLYLEDGAPLRAAGFANVNGLSEAMTELSGGIEVLRGPGTALHGSNALHGVINVLTLDPRTAKSGWRVGASSLGKRDFGALLVVPDTLALSLDLREDEGWRASSGFEQSKAAARRLGALGAWRYDALATIADLDQETAGFARGQDAYRDPDLARANPNPDAYRDTRSLRAQVRLEREAAGGLFTLTPFSRSVRTRFPQHFLPHQSLEQNDHASLGAMATWAGDLAPRLSLTAGADLDLTRGVLVETQALPSFGPFPQGVHYDYVVGARVAAAYVRGHLDLGPAWRVTTDLRAESVAYDYETRAPSGTEGRFRRPADRRDVFDFVNPGLSVQYAPAATWLAYARAARSARAPQTSDLYRLQDRQEPGEIGTERLDSVEAGVRAWRSWGEIELVGFDMDKRGLAFRDADGLNVTDGASSHRGFELSFQTDLTPRLTFELASTRAEHRYGFDRPSASNAAESIASGSMIDTAPKRLESARLRWRPLDRLEGELEWTHVGAYFMDAANTARYPGHEVLALRLDYRVTDDVSLSVHVRNLANTAYADRADFAFGSARYFPGEERGVSLRVGSAF